MAEPSEQPANLSPYEADILRMIDERRARIEQLVRDPSASGEIAKLEADIAWLEQRLASYRRGVAWFRVQRLRKAPAH